MAERLGYQAAIQANSQVRIVTKLRALSPKARARHCHNQGSTSHALPARNRARMAQQEHQ